MRKNLFSALVVLALFVFSVSSLFSQKSKVITNELNTFTDNRDGKKYEFVQIGNLYWMTENLAFNANPGKVLTGDGCWAYDNVVSNIENYGYLYKFHVVENACPEGWRLPTSAEAKSLETYLTKEREGVYRALLTKLKMTMGGFKDVNGGFTSMGDAAIYWTSSAEHSNDIYRTRYQLRKSEQKLEIAFSVVNTGIAVRCVKKTR